MKVEGIDVSQHQGWIDWRAVAASGVRFAYLRALEGQTPDPTFERNRREALEAGLWVGAYAYLRARHPGRWQADLLAGLLGDLGPRELLPVVDVESLDERSAIEAQACLLGWVERMKAIVGAPPVVYTYPDFWARRLGGAVLSELAGCDLWIAHYGVKAPTVPRPWTTAALWQIEGDTGRCPGVVGPCDRNVWTGQGDFEAWAGRRC